MSLTIIHNRKPSRAILRASLAIAVTAFACAVAYTTEPRQTVLLLSLFFAALIFLYGLHAISLRGIASAETDRLRVALAACRIQSKALEALAQAIDAKDQTTPGHTERTRIYAVELGRLLGARPDEIEALSVGALLHDVGKLAVPDHILNKPGGLTPAEFEKMKVHATVGAQIVSRVGFPYPVEDVVRHHHERWDGSGYPDGLEGDQIPLAARITSVVDFYDVMRCERPYRAGMGRDETLSLLERMAGEAFDPRVVETFIKHVGEFERKVPQETLSEYAGRGGGHATQEALPAATEGVGARQIPHMPPGLSTIAEAQREVAALSDLAQSVGATLNLSDTAALVAAKVCELLPCDACVIYLLDEDTGRALPVFSHGLHADFLMRRALAPGEGVTGSAIAHSRTVCGSETGFEVEGAPADVAPLFRQALSSPLRREEGSFGAVTLYSSEERYTVEHAGLLEAVCLHTACAVSNSLAFERTKETALTDPITGLPNDRAVRLLLDHRIAECRRTEDGTLALLSLDLKEFGAVNERYGHGAGDLLLAAMAGRLKGHLRQMDTLARLSGDEFLAVLPGANAEEAALAGERLCAAAGAEEFSVGDRFTTRIEVCFGVGCFPDDGETAEEVIRASAGDRLLRSSRVREHTGPGVSSKVLRMDVFR